MRVPLGLLTGAIGLLLIAAVTLANTTEQTSVTVPEAAPEEQPIAVPLEPAPVLMTPYEEPLDIAPEEQTVHVDPPEFPEKEHLQLIGRIAEGIYYWKVGKKEERKWYFCGEPYEKEEAKDLAVEIAYHFVHATWLVEQNLEYELNVWGALGTSANESSFDLCAFGLYPRKAAYKTLDKQGKKVLKPNRLTVSHTFKEVVRAIHHEKMVAKFRTYDLGMLQTLDMFYRQYLRAERMDGKREDLMTWEGFYWQIHHMAKRGKFHDTDRPWMYWPGYRSEKYDKKVTKHAKRLGAKDYEI
jgi:hypothetical protein